MSEKWDTHQKACSDMACGDRQPHEPHNWDSDVVIYGPYHCLGVPRS